MVAADNPNLLRPLFCPICGAKIMSPVTDTNYPEIHRLPDHYPALDAMNDANLCAGVVVTVTLDLDTCSSCGVRISKHPSRLCRVCYCKENEDNVHAQR